MLMAKRKAACGGAVGKGGVNPAPVPDNATVRVAAEQLTLVPIDFDNNIIAGHGRVEAARAEGMTEVPCVLVSNLTEAQRKAYILADNRLSETATWDTEMLKIELDGLTALSFDTGIIGFNADAIKSFGLDQADVDSAAEPIQQEADDAKTFDHVLILDKQKIVLTDDEAKDFKDRLNFYIDRCGVSFGFIRSLLDGQMG